LDWRQDFGGLLELGDIYYDLAKLNHGLIINHEIINRDLFFVKESGRNIHYDFHRKQILVECECLLKHFCLSRNYDYDRVRVLTALIFLNIAGLHHYPYCLLLYYLGKNMLAEFLNK